MRGGKKKAQTRSSRGTAPPLLRRPSTTPQSLHESNYWHRQGYRRRRNRRGGSQLQQPVPHRSGEVPSTHPSLVEPCIQQLLTRHCRGLVHNRALISATVHELATTMEQKRLWMLSHLVINFISGRAGADPRPIPVCRVCTTEHNVPRCAAQDRVCGALAFSCAATNARFSALFSFTGPPSDR